MRPDRLAGGGGRRHHDGTRAHPRYAASDRSAMEEGAREEMELEEGFGSSVSGWRSSEPGSRADRMYSIKYRITHTAPHWPRISSQNIGSLLICPDNTTQQAPNLIRFSLSRRVPSCATAHEPAGPAPHRFGDLPGLLSHGGSGDWSGQMEGAVTSVSFRDPFPLASGRSLGRLSFDNKRDDLARSTAFLLCETCTLVRAGSLAGGSAVSLPGYSPGPRGD